MLIERALTLLLLDIDLGDISLCNFIKHRLEELQLGWELSPDKFETNIGVVKAYTTRVGEDHSLQD